MELLPYDCRQRQNRKRSRLVWPNHATVYLTDGPPNELPPFEGTQRLVILYSRSTPGLRQPDKLKHIHVGKKNTWYTWQSLQSTSNNDTEHNIQLTSTAISQINKTPMQLKRLTSLAASPKNCHSTSLSASRIFKTQHISINQGTITDRPLSTSTEKLNIRERNYGRIFRIS